MISSFYINNLLDMNRLQFHHAMRLFNISKVNSDKPVNIKSLNSEEVRYEQVSVL